MRTYALLLPLLTASVPTPAIQDEGTVPAPAAEVEADYLRAVAISSDGTRIATGDSAGRVVLLDAEARAELAALEPLLSDGAWKLAFSPDGARLAGLGHDGKLFLWKLEADAATPVAGPLDALPEHGEVMRGYPFGAELKWSPSGERLVTGNTHGQNSLWSKEGDLVLHWEVSDPLGDPQLEWSADGSRLLTADGSKLQVRSGSSGSLPEATDSPAVIPCRAPIVAVALHPDGRLAATGHADSRLKLWDLETGALVFEEQYLDLFIPEPQDEVASIAFSPSGERVALALREGTHIFVVDVETRKRVWVSDFLGAHFFEVMQLRWTPDGSRLWYAFQCGGGKLYCIDPELGGSPTLLGKASPPSFGASRGVILSRREVVVVSFGGQRTTF